MTQPRFVPVLDLPDDWSGAITVIVQQGQVRVLDEHPDDVAPGAPRQVLGTLDGAACWAVDLDGDGVPDVVVDGLVPLMGLYGRVDDHRWTLAGRAVQLVEWDRTTRFCGRCGTATELAPGERARRCPACGLLAFPRLAPAVITLIERGAAEAPLFVLLTRLASIEAAVDVTDLAMKACGGAAFSRHMDLERVFRDARAGCAMAPTADHLREFTGRALTGLPLF